MIRHLMFVLLEQTITNKNIATLRETKNVQRTHSRRIEFCVHGVGGIVPQNQHMAFG